MLLRRDGFAGGKRDGLLPEGCGIEYASEADYDAHDGEGTCEIVKEGDGSVHEHLQRAGAAVEGGNCGELDIRDKHCSRLAICMSL